jgi:hypothetical protein
LLVSIGNNMLLCQKSQKVTEWLFSYAFLKFNAKKTLTTNLLFEKCQTTELIIFYVYNNKTLVIPRFGVFFSGLFF